jgi:hypothetical protein
VGPEGPREAVGYSTAQAMVAFFSSLDVLIMAMQVDSLQTLNSVLAVAVVHWFESKVREKHGVFEIASLHSGRSMVVVLLVFLSTVFCETWQL